LNEARVACRKAPPVATFDLTPAGGKALNRPAQAAYRSIRIGYMISAKKIVTQFTIAANMYANAAIAVIMAAARA
jgi:hypothetical protein